jgi:uncharacterized protein YbcI
MDRVETLGGELARRFCALLQATGGRSPTRTRVFVNEEVLTVICEETLNPSEKDIYRRDVEAVARSRRAIQRMVRMKFAPVIEELTGTGVVASTSGHAIEPDIGIYNFVLTGPPAIGPQGLSANPM